jgi:hypothetical protein
MQAYSFAILFGPRSAPDSQAPLVATHLPLVVKDEGPHGLIELRLAQQLRRSALRPHVELHRHPRLRHP